MSRLRIPLHHAIGDVLRVEGFHYVESSTVVSHSCHCRPAESTLRIMHCGFATSGSPGQ